MKYPRLIISFATDGIIAMQFRCLFISIEHTRTALTSHDFHTEIVDILMPIQLWICCTKFSELSPHIVARGQKPIRTEMDVSNVDIVSSICCGSSVGGGDAIRFMCHEPNWCNTIFPSTHTPPRAPQNAIKLVAVPQKHNSRTTIHILYFYVCGQKVAANPFRWNVPSKLKNLILTIATNQQQSKIPYIFIVTRKHVTTTIDYNRQHFYRRVHIQV